MCQPVLSFGSGTRDYPGVGSVKRKVRASGAFAQYDPVGVGAQRCRPSECVQGTRLCTRVPSPGHPVMRKRLKKDPSGTPRRTQLNS